MTTNYGDGQDLALLTFGLVKEATVPGAVKQYRRAAQAFEEASRPVRTGGPGTPITKGWALHGTDELPSILESRRAVASPIGQTGQYGSGVYFWRGFPGKSPHPYLHSATQEGFATDLTSLPNRRAAEPNIFTGKPATDAVVSGPSDYRIRPKDTAIIDTATRAQDKSLPSVMADAQDAKMRTTDSAIFQRAKQQILSVNAKKPRPSPTKQELTALLRRRQSGVSD